MLNDRVTSPPSPSSSADSSSLFSAGLRYRGLQNTTAADTAEETAPLIPEAKTSLAT